MQARCEARGLCPHLLFVFEHHVAVAVEGLDSREDLMKSVGELNLMKLRKQCVSVAQMFDAV
jgi:hypothetical protein